MAIVRTMTVVAIHGERSDAAAKGADGQPAEPVMLLLREGRDVLSIDLKTWNEINEFEDLVAGQSVRVTLG